MAATIEERVKEQNARFRHELTSINDSILRHFPMKDYLKDVNSCTGYWRRALFSKKRKLIFENIAAKYGDSALTLYLKLGLCYFIADSLQRISRKSWPSEIKHLCYEWFNMVFEDFSAQGDDYYNYRFPSFCHDVLVCILKSIPVGGAWTVDVDRVRLLPFICGGVRQCIDYSLFLAFKTRGLAPFYVIHTAPRALRHFNPREMNLAYLRIAELIKMNPRIRGIYRRSWFLDPKLEDITPNLAYLRQIPQQNGAGFFVAGSNKSDVKHATAISSIRRELHAKGKYTPTGYAYIWPRRDFLNWVDKMNSAGLCESERLESTNG